MVDARGPTERTGTPTPRGGGAAGLTLPIVFGAGALLLLLGLALGFLLWRDDEEIFGTREETTVGSIAQDPQSWVGERVIVSGEVSQILTPNAYVLGGEQFVGGGELLVIGAPPVAGNVPTVEDEVYPQDIVQVSGEVREFNRAELEEEWGADFPAEAFEGREGQPVLVGEVFSVIQRVQDADAEMVDVADILDDPNEYAGERVSVADQISAVYSERVFILGDGLIVIDTTDVVAETALVEGANIEVAGDIGEFDQADLDEDLSQYEGNPVLHAELIQILDAGD